MSREKKLIETIRELMEGEFNGYIKINFSQGSLGRIEQSEELDATITHLEEKTSNHKSAAKDLRRDNVIDIKDGTVGTGHCGHSLRSEHNHRSGQDRRSGNGKYDGQERRSGKERRSCASNCVDRRSLTA